MLCALAVLTPASVIAQEAATEKSLDPEVKQQVVSKVTDILTRAAYVPGVDFAKVGEYLETEKEKIDAAKSDEELQSAINSALAKFGMSHVVLTTPRMAEQRRTQQTVGVGITTQPDDEGHLVIIRTAKDASAEKAGIVPGDVVTAVDGKPVNGISGIPGPEGTTVTLTIRRADGKSKDFTLVRKPFSIKRPEELTWVSKDTARLAIYTFDFSYNSENVEKLMTEALRAQNLIIDLRDNGGGAVRNLEHLMGMLLPPDKPIGTFVSRSLVRQYQEATSDPSSDPVKVAAWTEDKIMPSLNRRVPRFKGNVVVLVNRFSGSASEIAAAALREGIGAKVVGSKSAGAVLVSVIVPATNGFMLQYPLMDYISAKGLRLEGNGVTPDVVAEEPKIRLPNTKDEALDKAKTVFTSWKTEASGLR